MTNNYLKEDYKPLEIVRGDTAPYKFRRICFETGEPIIVKAEKAYFTVKRNSNDTAFLFQKTIEDMTFDNDGYYHFTIEPKDTDNLPFGTYVYDIEIVDGAYKQTISPRPPYNQFKILPEVTYKCNEV